MNPIETTPAPEAKKKSHWQCTPVQGLYQRNGGIYYTRYKLAGKTAWRSLDTDVFTVAKLRHQKSRGITEVSRQSGVQINSDLRTLGALAAQIEREVDKHTIEGSTKTQYHVWLQRLREHWRQGEFDTTLARSVTRDTLTELRKYLSEKAELRCGWRNAKVGYSPAVVNQTLTMLRILLKLALDNGVISQSPFDENGPFGGSVFMPRKSRRPELPSNEAMERVFNDIARGIVLDEEIDAEILARYRAQAETSAEHARFLAYSGMRKSEAAASLVEDDKGDYLLVRGGKTPSSWRKIPIIAPLRALIDKIKTKRIAGPMLGCKDSLKAIRRSCKRLGIPPLRQHDLRHYFGTVCVESGVPIPTVADWLGHADGGVMLMKVYRHLRDSHSLEAAKLVTLKLPAQAIPA